MSQTTRPIAHACARKSAAIRPPTAGQRMRQRLSRSLTFALAALVALLAACGTTPSHQDIQPLRTAAATVNQQTGQVFAEVNAFLRERQIDVALHRETLNESAFSRPLSTEDVAKWNYAFAVIDSYVASLQKLLDPEMRAEVQTELVGLGDAIGALDDRQLPAGVAAGFAVLGGLLIQMEAEKDALAAIRRADPGIQRVLAAMMDAVGRHQDDGIRGTVQASWRQVLAELQVKFLNYQSDAAKRREVVLDFVSALDKRDAQDASLVALRRSIGLLASAHAALAAARPGSAAMLELLQREYAAWQALRQTIAQGRVTGTQGGWSATIILTG